ncbi:hypothetical protein DFH94DRAFT_687703 [Russula ochroleuca]|uniref:Uncharacterized protein n=1 Tax=Russula ochroleuca TaxID=152965 RepID=A0A9P5N6I6_9AGAM|nr:hypothetical protein DFH94DRAFT_699978 [Russula ochroleuca]KAF8487231.1 hypothetical protein DFH94DRAFT_687703 [Russula ochroleuca]
MPRSKSIQSKQNVSAAVPAPMRVPTTTLVSAPIPSPQIPSPAADIELSKPAVDAKAQNIIVKVLLPEIESVSCEAWAKTGVHPRTGTGTTSHGEMLCVPVVNSRSRLHQNDLARYYLKELAAEKIVRRLGLMCRIVFKSQNFRVEFLHTAAVVSGDDPPRVLFDSVFSDCAGLFSWLNIRRRLPPVFLLLALLLIKDYQNSDLWSTPIIRVCWDSGIPAGRRFMDFCTTLWASWVVEQALPSTDGRPFTG